MPTFRAHWHKHFRQEGRREYDIWRHAQLRQQGWDPSEDVATGPLTDAHLTQCGCPACEDAINLRQMSALLGSDDTPYPSFAGVAQPNYLWTEHAVRVPVGVTAFRKRAKKSKKNPQAKGADITFATGASPTARLIKMHELLHARFTPEILDLGDAEAPIIAQLVEDVRLTHLANERGLFGDRADMHIPTKIIEMRKGETPSEEKTAALYIAAYGQPIGEEAWDSRSLEEFLAQSGRDLNPATKEHLKEWRTKVEAIMAATSDPRERFAKLATATKTTLAAIMGHDNFAWLSQQLGLGKKGGVRPLLMPGGLPGTDADGEPIDGEGEDKAKANISSNFSYWDGKASLNPRNALNDAKTAQNYSLDNAPDTTWGPMHVVLAPLSRNFRAHVRRKGVASPDGPIPKFFQRWFADKMLFERKGRRRGGTLLIDASGSMGWAWESTRELIEAAPAMTIAIYSSHLDHLYNGTKGILTIIARDGKLVTKGWDKIGDGGHGNGNVVDGPALAWLARQPRPRVWLSDGDVTGVKDRPVNENNIDAQRLVRLGAIICVAKPDLAVAAILRGA